MIGIKITLLSDRPGIPLQGNGNENVLHSDRTNIQEDDLRVNVTIRVILKDTSRPECYIQGMHLN